MLLTRYGANVNVQDAKGGTPAHDHAFQNSYLSLLYLIKQGAFLDVRDMDGGTPLYHAIRNGSYEATKVLLENGAVGCDVFRSTPAVTIAEARKPRLRHIFPTKQKEKYQEQLGQTALHVMASVLGSKYRPEIMRLLVYDYADYFKKPQILNRLDQNGYTALQWAASRSLLAARELVLAGADLEIRNPTSRISGTPLAASVQAGRLDIAKFLLENGANIFCRGPPEQELYSFLNEAVYCMGSKPEQRDQFRPLLEMTKKWIDEFNLLKVRDFAGRIILQYAIFSGEVEAVKALLDIGASQEDLVLSGWDLPANAWGWRNEHLWHAAQGFRGLNILDYAKKLRDKCSVDKTPWHNFASREVGIRT
ncbi:ankyrin [Stipitochalara longipes BDJ]|nr:ankyrin [Stipitochalara longipes BDJ]